MIGQTLKVFLLQTDWTQSQRFRDAYFGGLVFAITLAAALVGLNARDNGVAVLWPAAGVIAGFIAISSGSQRTAAAIGAFLALSIGNFTQNRSIATALVFMAGNIGQAFALALLLTPASGRPFRINSIWRSCGFFIATAVVVAVTGFFMAFGLRATGHATAPWSSVWWLWVSSHGIGIVCFTPAVLALYAILQRAPACRDWLESALVLATLAIASYVLVGWSSPSNEMALMLICATLYPILLWGALRSDAEWSAIAQLVIATVIISHAALGKGLFTGHIPMAQMFLLLTALCTHSLSGLVGERAALTRGRNRAESNLRAAHDTFRHLVERSPFGIYVIDADFKIVQVSDGAQKVFERVRPLIGRNVGEALSILWPASFADFAISRFRHTLETGETYHSPSTVERRADINATESYDWKIERINMPDGRQGVVCHFYDLSERQRHEEHVQKLMHEVNHRSKNMLGMVQAIARRTAATHPKDFIERFDRRIQALSANQDVLVSNAWKSVPLGELVRSQLAPFKDVLHARVGITGEKVEITAAAAQTIGMALHELATNAVKYGSLSNDAGRVEISWSVAADDMRFRMAWVEIGGPPVAKPTTTGFGWTVISSLVKSGLGCDAEIDFAPTGLSWRIDCPAERVLETSAGPRR